MKTSTKLFLAAVTTQTVACAAIIGHWKLDWIIGWAILHSGLAQ